MTPLIPAKAGTRISRRLFWIDEGHWFPALAFASKHTAGMHGFVGKIGILNPLPHGRVINGVHIGIAIILHTFGFNQKDMAFLFGAGTVDDAIGDDHALAFANVNTLASFEIKHK